MRDIKFLNAFNSIPGVGPATLRLLKKYFSTYEAAWVASDDAIKEARVAAETVDAIVWKRKSIHPDRELEKLVKENIWITTENDERYPALLKEIPAPPVILYGKGNLKQLDQVIGVVGTRKPTAYGLEVTGSVTQELARAGVGIVSGLALGIDGRAHEAALDAEGYTIAVLGSGVDHRSLFPSLHQGLARRIANAGGAVISEYAPGTPALKEHFPQRNRIISGLSKGVLVVEARERSGALITARFALEQNRDVFAIPGSILSSASYGPHVLIQEGAKLVRGASDIFEELGIVYNKEREQIDHASLKEEERTLLKLLEEPLTVDAIKEKTKFPTPVIIASLSFLELKGIIKNLGNDTFQKIN